MVHCSSQEGIVFLDRDGVINENRHDYVRSVDDLVMLPGSLDALRKLSESKVRSVVVSNQAGVGRGLIPADELDRINSRLSACVESSGGSIAKFYCCTHRKEDNCSCRKPGIGLLLQAREELNVDLSRSYFIGDALSDIQSGRAAGCKTVFVLSGRTSVEEMSEWNCSPDHVAATLSEAVDWVLEDRATKNQSR